MKKRVWTAAQIEQLRELYKTNSIGRCAEIMDINIHALRKVMRDHNLYGRGHMKFWTEEKVATLRALYPTTRNVDIAAIMGTKEAAIQYAAFKFRLVKPEEFKMEHAKKGQFKPGQSPPNKGVKMSAAMYEKAKATMFKKGDLPTNTLSDGAISIRPDKRGVMYRFIRVSQGKWLSYSRYLWEQHHGPIPKGMCVWHTDQDTLNDDINNLELLTKKENRIRNSGSVNLTDNFVLHTMTVRKSPEYKAAVAAAGLIETKRLQLQLNREIKKADDERNAKKRT